jgi:cell division protein FtsB
MASYYVYDPADPTGRILRTGQCPAQSIAAQAGPGQIAREGTADTLTQKIVAGVLTDKTPEEIAAGARPPVAPDDRPVRMTRLVYRLLVERLNNFDARIEMLTTAGQSLADRADVLTAAAQNQAGRLTTLETKAADYEQRIASLEALVADLQQQLAALQPPGPEAPPA